MNHFKYLSASLLALSLFTNVNTHCMLTKKLARKFVNTKPLMAKINSRHMCKQLRLPDSENNECLLAAIELFNSKETNNMLAALKISDAFVDSKRFYPIVLSLTMQGITVDDHNVQKKSLQMLTKLVNNDYAFPDAIIAAKKLTTSEDFSVRLDANDLFDALFAKNQGFGEGISSAVESMSLYGCGTLFRVLFKYDHGFEEGEKAGLAAVNTNSKRVSGLFLLRDLTDHNRAFGTTLKVLPMCMQSDHRLHEHCNPLFEKILALIRTQKKAAKSLNTNNSALTHDKLDCSCADQELIKNTLKEMDQYTIQHMSNE